MVIVLPVSVFAEDGEESSSSFSLTGSVYDSAGNPAAETSIKVDSMGSAWSEEGSYTYSGISEGEHTVRAYFMNNGHTVVYRKMYFDSDMQLDWHEGKNWITCKIIDELGQVDTDTQSSSIILVENNLTSSLDNGRVEFGPYTIGDYYTLIAEFSDIDDSTQYTHFKLQTGSATEPSVNDFEFRHGMNSRYGFFKDLAGNPVQGVTISDGDQSTTSNSDGFFLLQNMVVGSEKTFTFVQGETQVADNLTQIITSGEGWMNVTAEIEVKLPDNASFITQVQVIPMEPFLIEWQGGNFTDSYSLYKDGYITYSGVSSEFTFSPQETGSFEFTLEAINLNGSTESFQSLILIVLPEDSSSDLWAAGMYWNYSKVYTPASMNGVHNMTVTAIGKEPIVDAFGVERESFLTRITDEHAEEDEKSYRWIDSKSLLPIHTYWVEGDLASSYFQEGFLGWNFTNIDGTSADLLDSDNEMNLHFNRTNIIGVPGHPNGYDDTMNIVSVTKDVEITTPAGTFSTTYYSITDLNDGIISWELWYNDTVRNWVKKIDRLPGSHSDSVISELTSFEVPMSPQFITEQSNFTTKDYDIEWAPFQGASSYELIENGVIVYVGENTSFRLLDQEDGIYTYQINALISDNQTVEGSILEFSVDYQIVAPLLFSNKNDVQSGELVAISWAAKEGISWYSVIIQNGDEPPVEVYNGTENQYSTSELEVGINRIRISAGNSDGKFSDYSDSIFIEVESEKSEEVNSKSSKMNGILEVSIIVMLLLIIISWRRGL